MNITMTALVIILFVYDAYASHGDMDPHYQTCLRRCLVTISQSDHIADLYATYPRYYWWDNKTYCSFYCIEEVTTTRKYYSFPDLKYYGHWPFKRLFGLEEPASVMFSFGNAIPHIQQLLLNLRDIFSYTGRRWNTDYLHIYVLLYPLFGLFAWGSSTLYHAMKSDMTSTIDYCCALNLLSFGLWLAFNRLIYRPQGSWISRHHGWMFALVCGVVSLQNRNLFYGNVLYDTHMRICIAISVLSIIIWTIWCSIEYFNILRDHIDGHQDNSLRHVYRKKRLFLCLVCQVWFTFAALLEIYDFPPIYDIFDAHSLWHLSTIPLGFLWYKFWSVDIELRHAEGHADIEVKTS